MTDWVLKGSIRGPAGEIPNVDQFLKIAGGALSNGDNEKIASLLIMGEGTSLSLDTSKTYSNIAVNGPSGSNKKIRLQSSSSSSTFTMDDKSVGSITDTILSGSGNALATDKAVKDYVDTSIAAIDIPEELPEGGTEGQVLTKTSNGEAWSDIPDAFPSGGTNGQVLTKTSDGEAWSDIPDAFPSGGNTGQVLTKTSDGEVWSDIPDALPSGGNTGQVLTKTSEGEAWSDIPDAFPAGGNTGQVLTKTEDGGEWADAPQPDMTGYVKTDESGKIIASGGYSDDMLNINLESGDAKLTLGTTDKSGVVLSSISMYTTMESPRLDIESTDDSSSIEITDAFSHTRAELSYSTSGGSKFSLGSGVVASSITNDASTGDGSALATAKAVKDYVDANAMPSVVPVSKGGTGVTTEDAAAQMVFSHAPEASPTQAGVVKTLSDQDFCEYMGIDYNPEDWS